MKIAKIFIILLLLSISHDTFSSEEAFINKYSVDKDLQEILDNHYEDISYEMRRFLKPGRCKHGVWTFSWLPGYYVKYNLDRIYGMERMQRRITKYNLDLITLPDKRIYNLKGRPTKLTNKNYVVIIPTVEEEKITEPMSLRLVQQMCTLMHQTGYVSMTKANYIRDKNGIITMIDTESTFDHTIPFLGFRRLLSAGHQVNDYTKKAIKYILREIAYLIGPKNSGKAYKEIIGYLKESKKTRTWKLIDYFDKQLV